MLPERALMNGTALPHRYSGKVRELFEVGHDRLLMVGGVPAPAGLQQADRLPEPLFTPTTKADEGHDLPVTATEAVDLVGESVYERCKEVSLALYDFGARHAASCGLILADTKFEFGE